LRDARSRLLGRAVRVLESKNNIQVGGVLVLNGVTHQMDNGLGWVDVPDRARACVKKVTYNFGDGLKCELELTREEARTGETIPRDAELMSRVVKEQVAMRRIVEQISLGQRPSQPSMTGDPQGFGGGTTVFRPTGG
jgi:hypothetical protein